MKYVSAVKRFESGIVYNPITLNFDDTVKTAKKIAPKGEKKESATKEAPKKEVPKKRSSKNRG